MHCVEQFVTLLEEHLSCPLEMAEENSPVTFGKCNQCHYSEVEVGKFVFKLRKGFPCLLKKKDTICTSTEMELILLIPALLDH